MRLTMFQEELLAELKKNMPIPILIGLDKAKEFYRYQEKQPNWTRYGGAYIRQGVFKVETIVWCPETNCKEYGTSSLFHELMHATGPRLGRKMFQDKGSYAHCLEEVIAEMGAASLMRHFGMSTTKSYEISMTYIAEYSLYLTDEDLISCKKTVNNAVLYILYNWLADFNEKYMLRSVA